ncbi:MAG: hypothetical protein KME27_18510 [Lyngbya sp. HA4199-MV5]|jgi:hypothetical protein|nr:hypothetical protein [Lyngbya sp. HA4199-MV5]
MNGHLVTYRQEGGIFKGSTLVLIAFATAFFPRILSAMGAPPAINFVHFAVVPLVGAIVFFQTRVKDRQQIATIRALATSLLLFLGAIIASALLNSAAAINVTLDFLLLTEGFILLLTILCIPISWKEFRSFRNWLLGFIAGHAILAFSQRIGIALGILVRTKATIEDNVQGVFYFSYGGHVVAASVSLFFSLYYLATAKDVKLWIRLAIVFAAFLQILIADAKQVLLVALVSWLCLILARAKNIRVTLQYAALAVVVVLVLFWCVENIELFRAYKTWVRPEIYGPDGDATVQKLSPLRIIPTYYESILNSFLGLGPGHTIGRLGGWMIRDYASILSPLGATSNSVVTNEFWRIWDGSYLDSSMFSPFWGWAAIWADLGVVGLVAYIYIWIVVWQRLCPDDLSKFVVFNVLINGFIFTLLEEPGFMLSVAVLIGLLWQERRLRRQQHYEQLSALAAMNQHPEMQ